MTNLTLFRALACAAVAVIVYVLLRMLLPGSVVTLQTLAVIVLIVLFLRGMRRDRAGSD